MFTPREPYRLLSHSPNKINILQRERHCLYLPKRSKSKRITNPDSAPSPRNASPHHRQPSPQPPPPPLSRPRPPLLPHPPHLRRRPPPLKLLPNFPGPRRPAQQHRRPRPLLQPLRPAGPANHLQLLRRRIRQRRREAGPRRLVQGRAVPARGEGAVRGPVRVRWDRGRHDDREYED